MNHDAFIREVRERAHIHSHEQAEAAIAATLSLLWERGWPEESLNDLASQLPEELADYVRYDGEQKAQPFSVDEFFRRVASREGADEPDAVYHARVVMEVLQEAVTGAR